MEQRKSVMEALIEIQSILKSPKSRWNEFGKYKFRSCEDILEAVKPLLAERGCLLTLDDALVAVADRVYIEATATIRLGDDSFSVKAYAREVENKKGCDPAQITGASSSYARKYALSGLFLLDDSVDADSMSYSKVEPESAPVASESIKASASQVRFLEEKYKELGVLPKLLEKYKISSVAEMSRSDATSLIAKWQNKK